MFRKILMILALVAAAISFAGIAPAYAQATRTWVSGVGDDVNPCSRTAPCKTFAGAISKTAAKGEINCLDPGGFGAVTITKSISIICHGFMGGILSAGTSGIVVNLPTAADRVLIDGIDINGGANGIDGIRMVGSGQLMVIRTTIQNVTGEGIDIVGAANARVVVRDSYILNAATGGINLQGNGAVVNGLTIDNVRFNNTGTYALRVSATGAAVMSNSIMAGSTTSITILPGGTVTSYGGNIIRNGGAPTQTLPTQ